jgi:hypothetical protein
VSTKTPLKLKPEEPKMIYFNIEESDTGGTLVVDLAILRPQVGVELILDSDIRYTFI